MSHPVPPYEMHHGRVTVTWRNFGGHAGDHVAQGLCEAARIVEELLDRRRVFLDLRIEDDGGRRLTVQELFRATGFRRRNGKRRRGNAPFTMGSKPRPYRYFRHPRNAGEKREWYTAMDQEVATPKVRAKRNPRNLADAWDDRVRTIDRCWKRQRRTQYHKKGSA